MELELEPITLPGVEDKRPMVIAGPCSAETEEQVMSTAKQLADKGLKLFRNGIDDQLRLEVLDFFQCGEAVGVVDKTQLVRIDVEHSRLMLETQDVCEERAHFPGSKY